MSGIGLRLKICLGILLAVLVASSAVAYLRVRFQYEDRISSLQITLYEDAERLSGGVKELQHPPDSEHDWSQLVGESLAESPLGLLVNIYDSDKTRIYSNCLGVECRWGWPNPWIAGDGVHRLEMLDSEVDQRPIVVNRTLYLGEELVYLQLVRSQDKFQVYGSQFSRQWLIYTILVLGLILLVSLFLTGWVLGPLGQLADYIEKFTAQIRSPLPRVQPMDPSWLKSSSSQDEFYRITQAVKSLSEKVHFHANLTRQWTSQMAHELKTPLAILRVELESLKNQGEIILNQDAVDGLLAEIDRLGQVISGFLDWAAVEGSVVQQKIVSVKLADLVEQEVARFSSVYPDRAVQLIVRDRSSVLAHPQHMEQLVDNLLDNALKYSGPGGKVEVGLCKRCLRVSDSGPGIPSEVLNRIGSPFNRGSHSKEQSASSGLGLAWAFSIARKYDWKIEIYSSSQGTAIEVIFSL